MNSIRQQRTFVARAIRIGCTLLHLGVIHVMAGMQCGLAQDASNQDSRRLLDIVETLEDQRAQRSPIWVEYTLSEYISSDSNTRRSSPSSRREHEEALPELRRTAQVEWAQKGNLMRSSFSGPLIVAGVLREDSQPTMHVYDGEKAILFDNEMTPEEAPVPVYKFSVDPKQVSAHIRPLDVSGESQLFFQLQGWRDHPNNLTATVRDEDGDAGEPLVFVELVPTRAKTTSPVMQAWLLPDKGYAPKRFLSYFEDGALAAESDVMEYQQIDGIHYPKRAVQKDYSPKGDLNGEREIDVQSVVFRGSEIPDSLFRSEIPAHGVALYDLDRKAWVRNPERIAELIGEQVSGGLGARVFLCVLAAVILVLAAVLRQRHRRRGRLERVR